MIHINFSIRECLNPFGSPRPKTERTTDKDYIAWHVENRPYCIVCGKIGQRDHAVAGRSKNSRASDYLIFANCAEHHIGRSKISVYEQRWNVDVAKDIERSWQLYALHVGLTGSFASLSELEIAFKKGKKWKRAA